jgi:hypothetical protein
MAQGRSGLVEGNRQTLRLVFADDLHQRRGKAVDRIGLQAFGIVQRRQGKKGPIDVRAPVNQVEGRPAGDSSF